MSELKRMHDLDWLRVIAVTLVLFFHVGMFFNSWGWHIKNEETTDSLKYIMSWMHYWRMPLLLFVSGAGTFLALRSRPVNGFIKERFRRLIIPLIVGMLVIVPPQIWAEKMTMYSSYLEFWPTIFTTGAYPEGNLSWHHLWFVLYLFLYSLLAIPLLIWLRSPAADNFYKRLAKFTSTRWGFMSFSLVIILSQVLLKPFFPEETHALVDDWAAFTLYFCFFLGGFILYRSADIWYQLKNRKWFHLSIGIGTLCILEFMITGWVWDQFPNQQFILEVIWHVNTILLGWSWVLAIIGFGQEYLTKAHPALQSLNEGIYPFYILHQTVIILLALPLMNTQWPIGVEYLMLSAGSLTVSVGLYYFFIRPFNIMRFLFGMKPIGKPETEKTADKRLFVTTN